jgi:polysaccharide deacetylase 2 family uncharacterized protein YibQ
MGALGAFAWWWWTRPAPGGIHGLPGHNIPPGYPADPSDASRRLVEALHARLEKSDLLKLLDEPVRTDFDFSSGEKVRTYREVYRLPNRVEPQHLAAELSDAARGEGASLLGAIWMSEKDGDRTYDCRFGFPVGWAPVTVGFREVRSPRLAVVIDDAGYAAGNTLDGFWNLKVPATVAIIPELEFSTQIAQEAPSHGWEVICHMPMEGHEAVADGAYRFILKRTTHPGVVTDTLTGALAGLPNCRGMNNHMGSRATEDRDLMLQVGHFLHSRGMYFLDSRTSDKTVAYPTVRKAGVPAAERNVFLDNEEEMAAIEKQFAKAVAMAKKRGSAVVIGHFRKITLEALADSVPLVKAQGVKFVYLSELVH